MRLYSLKRIFVGSPFPTAQARHERLTKVTGLAVLGSDPLSSVAYATEEILLVLILAGTGVLAYSVPIGFVIAVVIAIVVNSYRQTIPAYPQGASAYIVAKDNLGTFAGLTAGAALLIDYTLTVAVSVSAGVAAITSAFPALYPERVLICVLLVVGIAVANLRGVRESGRMFALPTYLFIAGFLGLLGAGFLRYVWLGAPEAPSPAPPTEPVSSLGVFLVLRAFASGAVALTGIEAISDGVTAFKPPEVKNARTTLAWLGATSITLFVGTTLLASLYGVLPREEETVVSQLAWQVFGGGPLYYYVQVVSTLILIFAANTSFADFPRLSFFMARDGFLPRQFGNRGDRLVFSNGILILGTAAIVLIVIFGGSTHALIPLYAVGVFTSFTLSQASMVRRWLRQKPPGWWWRATINGVGAATTGLVMVVIAMTKFVHGAWIVVLLIPIFITVFFVIHRHYRRVAEQLSLEGYGGPPPIRHTVLVLIGDLHRGVVQALQYAKTLSPDTKAVYVELDPDGTHKLEEKWVKWGCGVPLVVLTSPYRSLLGPFLDYLDHLQGQGQNHMVTIVLPEFIPARWWQHLLHNQTALLIKGALLFRKNVVVTDVPYHLKR
ncbi:MAG: APC family permease [Candidatus Rokubacteria bacterium]|nr:APC family permease [Candidatus Rokubacteria bacterium]